MTTINCKECGQEFDIKSCVIRKGGNYCSKKCMNTSESFKEKCSGVKTGKKNPMWKDGKFQRKTEYEAPRKIELNAETKTKQGRERIHAAYNRNFEKMIEESKWDAGGKKHLHWCKRERKLNVLSIRIQNSLDMLSKTSCIAGEFKDCFKCGGHFKRVQKMTYRRYRDGSARPYEYDKTEPCPEEEATLHCGHKRLLLKEVNMRHLLFGVKTKGA